MYNAEIKCSQCGEMCVIEGECPKFYAWCDTCNDYADFDIQEYTADYIGGLIDYTYDHYREM